MHRSTLRSTERRPKGWRPWALPLAAATIALCTTTALRAQVAQYQMSYDKLLKTASILQVDEDAAFEPITGGTVLADGTATAVANGTTFGVGYSEYEGVPAFFGGTDYRPKSWQGNATFVGNTGSGDGGNSDAEYQLTGNPTLKYGPGYPIGFDFDFNGATFDRVGISGQGWISFGNSSDGNNAVAAYTQQTNNQNYMPLYETQFLQNDDRHNRVVATGVKGGGYNVGTNIMPVVYNATYPSYPGAELRYETIGTAPNRVFVVQWLRYGFTINSLDPQYYRQMDFQIRLYEGSNNVEIRFGKAWRSNTTAEFATGLVGKKGGTGATSDFSSFGLYDAGANVWRNWPYAYTAQTNHNGYPGSTEFSQRIPWTGAQGYSPYNSYGSGSAEDYFGAIFTPTNSKLAAPLNVQPRFIQGTKANTPDMMSFVWEPPTCLMAQSNFNVTNVGLNSATLNWDGTGDFEWAVDTGNDPENAAKTGTSSGNSANVTGLLGSTDYNAWVRTDCGGGAKSMWSKATFQTLPCVPPSYTYAYTISEVTIADISNTSSDGASSSSTDLTYEDFTNITAHMVTDEDFPFTVKAQAPYGAYVYFFFDWDQDGVFEDMQKFGPQTGSPATFTGTVHVPGSANTGATRMRVVQEYSGYSLTTGCEAVNYGQYEDYTVEVALNTCPAPKSPQVSNIGVHSADFSWTDAQVIPDNGYDWQVLDPGNNVVASGNTSGTTASVASGLITNTTYTFRVRSACTGEESSWNPKTFTTLIGCGATWEAPGGYNTLSDATYQIYDWTFCPEDPGDAIWIDWTYWGGLLWDNQNIPRQASAMFIYDGDDDTAPLIAGDGTGYSESGWTVPAGGWNYTAPPMIISTHNTGCITIKVYSRGSWTTTGQGWQADIICAPAPTCWAPTDNTVSNITVHTADLSWDEGDSPDVEWVIVEKGGDPDDVNDIVASGTSDNGSDQATGLDAYTEYTLYTRGLCDNGNDPSMWSDPGIDFRTQLGCGVNDWEFYYSNAFSAYPSPIDTVTVICPDNVGDVVTVTPTHFKFGGSDQGLVSVYFYDGNGINAPMFDSGLPAKVSGPNSIPAGGYRGTAYDNVLPGPFTSTDPSGCVTVRLLSYSGYFYDTGMKADISCAAAPACSTPNLVDVYDVGGTDAWITWSNTSSDCIIEYGPTGFTPGTGATAGTNGTIASSTATAPFHITGLDPVTAYDVYVRQDCGNDGFSANSWKYSFATSFDCSTATLLTCGTTESFSFDGSLGPAAYDPTQFDPGTTGCFLAGNQKGNQNLYKLVAEEDGDYQLNYQRTGGFGQMSFFVAEVDDGCAAGVFTCIGSSYRIEEQSYATGHDNGSFTFHLDAGEYYILAKSSLQAVDGEFHVLCPGIPLCTSPVSPANGSFIAVNANPIQFQWEPSFGALAYDIYFGGALVLANYPGTSISDPSYTSAAVAALFGIGGEANWNIVPKNTYGTADCPTPFTFRVGGNGATYAVEMTEGEALHGNNFTENGYTNQNSQYWGEDFWTKFTASDCADSVYFEYCVPITGNWRYFYGTLIKASDNSVVQQFNSVQVHYQEECTQFPSTFDWDWYNEHWSDPDYEDRYILGLPVEPGETYYLVVDRYGVGVEFDVTFHEITDPTDSDGDGIPDCMDSCPFTWGQEGDPCDVDAGYSEAWVIDCDCVQGNRVAFSLTTDGNPEEITWEFTDEYGTPLESGSPAQANTVNTESIFLPGNCYGFRLTDSGGDGITGGGWELRDANGKLILRDDFADGGVSPMFPGQSPAYGEYHSFCLPLGPVDIHPGECGIMNNHVDNKVYAVKQAGKNYQGGTLNYQFEFANPDSGRIRRIAVPRNYVIFSEMSGLKPLVPGITYFAHVRTDKEGPLASANWGTGCEMALETQNICTQLIDDQNHQYYSCGVTKRFKKGNWLVAQPVYGAQQYEFRVYIPGEYDHTFVRSNYKLELGWSANEAPALAQGSQYFVEVRVKVNNVWGDYCTACTVLIDNNPQIVGGHMVQVFGEATLWPNPARDGQVNLNIDGITGDAQHIIVDVKDIYGQQVYGQEFENTGDRFNAVLNLPGDIATGIYLVNITVNGEVTTKRLSIVR